jgi:hypothetical protein
MKSITYAMSVKQEELMTSLAIMRHINLSIGTAWRPWWAVEWYNMIYGNHPLQPKYHRSAK